MYLTGVDPTVLSNTLNEDGSTYRPDHEVGAEYMDDTGKVFKYCKAAAAIAVGDVCVIDEAGTATEISTTTSAPAAGQGMPVGVAVVAATAANQYFWLQIKGPIAAVNVGTGCAVHTALNSTATAGRLDDDATAGAEVVAGLTTTAAESGNSAAGLLNYPYVGRTL